MCACLHACMPAYVHTCCMCKHFCARKCTGSQAMCKQTNKHARTRAHAWARARTCTGRASSTHARTYQLLCTYTGTPARTGTHPCAWCEHTRMYARMCTPMHTRICAHVHERANTDPSESWRMMGSWFLRCTTNFFSLWNLIVDNTKVGGSMYTSVDTCTHCICGHIHRGRETKGRESDMLACMHMCKVCVWVCV